MFGHDHPSTLTVTNNMGNLLGWMGKPAEAVGYMREALAGRRRVLGDDHEDTLSSINNMAVLLSSTGRLEEALLYFEEALATLRRVLGDNHPTTLTAINLIGGHLVLGHIGDSRCYLMRDGELRQLTTDHAVREPANYLTRCIGGGQKEEKPDLLELTLQPGDLVVLVTDGLWSVVTEGELAGILASQPPQLAADALLHAANAGGGPDNSTVLVAQVRRADGELGNLREVELAREEQRMRPMLPTPRGSLAPARWPLAVLALALVLLAVGTLKLVVGIDLVAVIVDWVRARFV